jgi:hypothetical protein
MPYPEAVHYIISISIIFRGCALPRLRISSQHFAAQLTAHQVMAHDFKINLCVHMSDSKA